MCWVCWVWRVTLHTLHTLQQDANCVLLPAHHRESALWARITLAMFRLKFHMSVCVFFVDVSRVTCLNVHVHYINFVPWYLTHLFSIFSTPFAKNKSVFLIKNRTQNLPYLHCPHDSGPLQWARSGVGLKPSATARPEPTFCLAGTPSFPWSHATLASNLSCFFFVCASDLRRSFCACLSLFW